MNSAAMYKFPPYPPLFWYKTINIEDLEAACKVRLTKSTTPPLEIISWDKESVYLRSAMGLIYSYPITEFFCLMNFYLGTKVMDPGIINYPIAQEDVLKLVPPTNPEEVKDLLLYQHCGLIVWGLKRVLDLFIGRKKR